MDVAKKKAEDFCEHLGIVPIWIIGSVVIYGKFQTLNQMIRGVSASTANNIYVSLFA